jgi:hypothetical protein
MLKVCAYAECGLEFTPKTHNQRYHSSECCRLATNSRIMENYYEKKSRRQGRIRVCASSDCTTQLSRYNDSRYCGKCASRSDTDTRKELLGMLSVSGAS